MKLIIYILQEIHRWYKYTGIHNRNLLRVMAAIMIILCVKVISFALK